MKRAKIVGYLLEVHISACNLYLLTIKFYLHVENTELTQLTKAVY